MALNFTAPYVAPAAYPSMPVPHYTPTVSLVDCVGAVPRPLEASFAITDTDIDQSAEDIARLMAQRNNNLGYGIGVALRRSVEYLLSSWQSVKQGLFGTTRKVINFVAIDDHNNAFGEDTYPSTYNRVILEDQGYEVDRKIVHRAQDICEELETHHLGEQFDGLVISGHGRGQALQFGPNGTPGDSLNARDIRKSLSCLPKFLKADAKVVYISCSAGKLQSFDLNEDPNMPKPLASKTKDWLPNFIFASPDENIALSTFRFLQETHPEIQVAAPHDVAYGVYIHSLEPLNIEAPAKHEDGGFVDSSIVYDKQSVAKLDEAKAIQAEIPWRVFGYDFTTGRAMTRETLEQKLEENQSKLAEAFHFTPKHDQASHSHPYLKYAQVAMAKKMKHSIAQPIFEAGILVGVIFVGYYAVKHTLKYR